jgi:RPA family protein
MIERMTAKKTRIIDLSNGKWIKKEGMEPSFVETEYGEKISRARILAVIASKFVSEDQNFGSITLDDSTDTIRVKTFKTIEPIKHVEIGDMVDVIGKVKEWNGEIYIVPEIIRKIEDPNLELLRKLEIAYKLRSKTSQKDLKTYSVSNKETLKKEVLKLIQSYPEGIEYNELPEKINAPENSIESVVNELLGEGICYEPTPGKIKKI